MGSIRTSCKWRFCWAHRGKKQQRWMFRFCPWSWWNSWPPLAATVRDCKCGSSSMQMQLKLNGNSGLPTHLYTQVHKYSCTGGVQSSAFKMTCFVSRQTQLIMQKHYFHQICRKCCDSVHGSCLWIKSMQCDLWERSLIPTDSFSDDDMWMLFPHTELQLCLGEQKLFSFKTKTKKKLQQKRFHSVWSLHTLWLFIFRPQITV